MTTECSEVVISIAQSNDINVMIHLETGFHKDALVGVHHTFFALRPIPNQTKPSKLVENLCATYFDNCMRLHETFKPPFTEAMSVV